MNMAVTPWGRSNYHRSKEGGQVMHYKEQSLCREEVRLVRVMSHTQDFSSRRLMFVSHVKSQVNMRVIT